MRHKSAAQFGVGISTVINWVRRFPGHGQRGVPGQVGRSTSRRRLPARIRSFWRGASRKRSLRCAVWCANWPTAASRSITVRCGTSSRPRSSASKKTVVASERDRPDIAAPARPVDELARRIVLSARAIDETWTKTNMARSGDGRGAGEELVAKVPYGHSKTLTFLAALRHDRNRGAMAARWPDQRRRLRSLCRESVGPTLRRGDLVIMDNLGNHKGKAVRRAIRSAEPSCSSSPNTRPTSIRSNRSSPSSSTYCAKPQRARSKLSSPRSANCSTPSPPRNAPTTSQTPDTGQPKNLAL